VLSLVALVIGLAGLDLRAWLWRSTEPLRYVMDIDNAFRQGTRTLATGYLERYDNNRAFDDAPAWTPMGLDYGPGRLAVAALWAHWVRSHVTAPATGPDRYTDQWHVEFYPYAQQLGLTYELCRPLLWLNLTGETLSAVALFLLVCRYASHAGTRPVRGNALGLVAATFFWFDPALLSNAHVWPQWDSWVFPFFLWALFLASVNCWFSAGVAIALGAMFKGQILFGTPLLLLWPLWQGRVGAAGRWVAGLAFGLAAVTAVWLVHAPGQAHGFLYDPGHTDPAAVGWAIDAAVAAVAVIVAVRTRSWSHWTRPGRWVGWTDDDPSGRRVLAAVAVLMATLAAAAAATVAGLWLAVEVSVAAGLVATAAAGVLFVRAARMTDAVPTAWPSRLVPLRPWISWTVRLALLAAAWAVIDAPLRRAGVTARWLAPTAVIGLATLAYLVPVRSLGHVAAAWVAAALLLCVPLFHTSSEWYFVGIAHGTTARSRMSNGDNNNLANLLETTWGWQLEEPVITLPPGPTSGHVAAFLEAIDKHVAFPPGKPVTLPLKYLLVSIWFASTVACSFGAARHDRSRHPRFLVAVAAPWVVMFAVLGQMHQRYLLWGAGLTCMAAAVSPGLALLHLLLSVVSMGQELVSMAATNHHDPNALAQALAPDPARTNLRWWITTAERTFIGWTPGMGWAVLLSAAVLVYVGVARGGGVTARRTAPPRPADGKTPTR
jgi:hypothetical protein